MSWVKCKHCGETYLNFGDNTTCVKCGRASYAPITSEKENIERFFKRDDYSSNKLPLSYGSRDWTKLDV